MTGSELRAILAHHHLRPTDCARLLGVTPRCVHLWLVKQHALPGTVTAYFRLFARSPTAIRLQELGRIIDQKRATLSTTGDLP